jgi:hypothetical protein
MNTRTIVLSLASIAGLASGPSTLEAGAASVPPIEWSTLPFLFFGSAIALFLVLAFQVILKKDKAFSLGWRLFAVGTVYAVVSGLSAILVALFSSSAGPSMFTILMVGLGMAAGLVALKAAFAGRLRSEA